AAGAGGPERARPRPTRGSAGPPGAPAPPPTMKATMSSPVTRPPRPVPRTRLGSTPCSRASRLTMGERNPGRASPLPPRGAGVGGGGGRATAARAGATAGGDLGAGEGGGGLAAARAGGEWGPAAAGPVDCGRCARLQDDRDLHADGHGLPFLDGDRADRALGRRRNLDRDLVGHDLDHRLVLADGIARFLEPLRDRPLGDALAELRHDDAN